MTGVVQWDLLHCIICVRRAWELERPQTNKKKDSEQKPQMTTCTLVGSTKVLHIVHSTYTGTTHDTHLLIPLICLVVGACTQSTNGVTGVLGGEESINGRYIRGCRGSKDSAGL